MEWNMQDYGISKAAKDMFILPSIINQIKLSQQTGCNKIIGFGHALLHSYLRMLPAEALFFFFFFKLSDTAKDK